MPSGKLPSGLSAPESVAAAGASAARTRGQLTPRVICFLPEFCARPTATRLRWEEVDSSPGFGTAPHSGTERSARHSDPARPLSPLLICSPPGFLDLPCLFCFA